MRTWLQHFWSECEREWSLRQERKTLWLCAILIPIFWAVAFWALFSQGLPEKLPVGWIDQDQSTLSVRLRDRFDAVESIQLVAVPNDESTQAKLAQGDLYALIHIPAEYEKNIRRGLGAPVRLDFHKGFYATATVLRFDIKSTLSAFSLEQRAKVKATQGAKPQAWAQFPNTPQVEAYFYGNPAFNIASYLNGTIVPGLIALSALMIFALTALRDWRERTISAFLERHSSYLLAGILGRLLPYFLLYIGIGGAWLTLYYSTLGWWQTGAFIYSILSFSLYLWALLGYLFLVWSLSFSWVIAMSGLICLFTPTFPFTGFSYPIESMDAFAQFFSNLLPLTHYQRLNIGHWVFGTLQVRAFLSLLAMGLIGISFGTALLKFRFPRWAQAEKTQGLILENESIPSHWLARISLYCKKAFLSKDTVAVFGMATIFYMFFYAWPYHHRQIVNVPVIIVDEAPSRQSTTLRQAICSVPAIACQAVTTNPARAWDAFSHQKVDTIITIDHDFAKNSLLGMERSIHLLSNGAYPVKGRAVQAGLMYLAIDPRVFLRTAPQWRQNNSAATLLAQRHKAPSYQSIYRFNEIGGYGQYVVPIVANYIGQAVLLMGITLLVGGWLREPQRWRPWSDTIAQSARPLVTLWLTFTLIGIFWLTYIHSWGLYWMDFVSAQNLGAMLGIIVLYAGAISALGLLLAFAFGSNVPTIPFIVMMSAPLLFMSGAIWPQENIPALWTGFSYLFPSRAGARALMLTSQFRTTGPQYYYNALQLVLLILWYGSMLYACWEKRYCTKSPTK